MRHPELVSGSLRVSQLFLKFEGIPYRVRNGVSGLLGTYMLSRYLA